MRSLAELIDAKEPAWPQVLEWIVQAAVDVEVLPAAPGVGEAALYAVQVTSRSPMGAIVLNAAGILVDHGWLRFLGAGGHARFGRSLAGWNEGRSNGYYLVADDAVGGMYAINGGALGKDVQNVYHFGADSLIWEPLEMGYSQFFEWALSPNLDSYYESLRWNGWESEIEKLTADQVMGIYPFCFTKGPPIGERHRAPVPIAEQYELQMDVQRQLDGQ